MWVFTTDGFFSAVQKGDWLVVRARSEADIRRLQAKTGGAVLHTPPPNDYEWRIRMAPAVWAEYVRSAAESIDYDNFKNAVGAELGPARARLYHDVWEVMVDLQVDPLWEGT
jgi:hypothetical protein